MDHLFLLLLFDSVLVNIYNISNDDYMISKYNRLHELVFGVLFTNAWYNICFSCVVLEHDWRNLRGLVLITGQ